MPAVRRKAPAPSRSSGMATPPRSSGMATPPRPSGMATRSRPFGMATPPRSSSMATPPRPSGMAIGSSPMPGRTVASPFNPWSEYYQSDTDSTLQNLTSSYNSGSCTEDTFGDPADSFTPSSDLPPELYKAYQGLAPVVNYSTEELMKLDLPSLQGILDEVNALTRNVIRVGSSHRWIEFDNMVGFSQKLSSIVSAKKAAAMPQKPVPRYREIDFRGIPGLEFAVGQKWVTMSAEEWQATYEDSGRQTADTKYLQSMYRNAMAPNVFGWDDVGASTSAQSEEPDTLGYTNGTYSKPKGSMPHTLDYCAYPYPTD